MGLRTSAEVQRYRGAVQYRASSGTGRSGVSARFWQGFGHRTGPKGSGTAVGFIWADSRGLATILDPFRAILVILGPTPYLRLQHLSCLNSRHLSCLSSRHLSCLNSRHLSCLNRRHLSCLNRGHPGWLFQPWNSRNSGLELAEFCVMIWCQDSPVEPPQPRAVARMTAVQQTPSN